MRGCERIPSPISMSEVEKGEAPLLRVPQQLLELLLEYVLVWHANLSR